MSSGGRFPRRPRAVKFPFRAPVAKNAPGPAELVPSNAHSFQKARVYYRQSGARVADVHWSYLSISNKIRWKRMLRDDTPPKSMLFFRNASCHELERVHPDAIWDEDIVTSIQEGRTEYGPAVIIPLIKKRRIMHVDRVDELVIAVECEQDRDALLHTIRLRIAPWQLLHRQMLEIKKSLPQSIPLERLLHLIPKISIQVPGEANQNASSDPGPSQSRNRTSELHDSWKKGEPLADTFKTYPDFVASVAVVVKQFFTQNSASTLPGASDVACAASSMQSASDAADTFAKIADITKAVSVVSSGFQVVSLSLRLVAMVGEMKRGRRIMPHLQSTVARLLSAVTESMARLLHPSADIHPTLISNMFEVQEKSLRIMGKIEEHMLRAPLSELFNTTAVKDIENAVDDLRKEVISVLLSGEQAKLQVTLKNALQNANCLGPPPKMHKRPKVSPMFVGRGSDLDKLKEIIDEHQSVAIMQYGGIGKTQLMSAFAERAENDGLAPGGSFWIRANGNKVQVLSSIATFTESLVGKRFQEEERSDPKRVLSNLEENLKLVEGRWLLCVDNADDPDVNGLVGELCRMAKDESMNGWVMVTSRQGKPVLWDGMAHEQKFQPKPLSVESSMVVLWRWKNGMFERSVTDEEILSNLKLLEENEPNEYKALRDLAGDMKCYGLAGLPLALVQAGGYIYSESESFVSYAELYEDAIQRSCFDDVRDLLQEIDNSVDVITSNQRTIWTTWKMNLDSLDEEALEVVRAFALFNSSPTPESLVKNLHPSFSLKPLLYRRVVRKGLVYNGSLMAAEENEGEVVFTMHRLVREYVIIDCKRDENEFKLAIGSSISAMYKCSDAALKEVGKRISNPPWEWIGRSRALLIHSVTLLQHVWMYSLRTPDFLCSSELESIFQFSFRAVASTGRLADALRICERFCIILEKESGSGTAHHSIMTTKRDMAIIKMKYGKLNEAQNLLEKCLTTNRILEGEDVDHPDVAFTLHQLGRVAMKKSEFGNAERRYESCIAMKRRLFGVDNDHPEIARVLHAQGDLYQEKGKHVEAHHAYNSSLAMKKRMHGEMKDHPDISRTMHELGNLQMKNGMTSTAEQLYTSSFAMKRRMYGADVDHQSLSGSMHAQAKLSREIGKLDEANKQCNKSIAMKKRLYGDMDHPDVSASIYEQGKIAMDKGNLVEARKLFNRSLTIQRRLREYDNGHLRMSYVLYDLGLTFIQCSLFRDAEQAFAECLSIRKRVYGENTTHSEIADCLEKLGLAMRNAGRHGSSEECYKTALQMNRFLSRKELQHGIQDFEERNVVDAERHFFNCIRMNLNMYRRLLDETTNEEFQWCVSRVTGSVKMGKFIDFDLIYNCEEYYKSHCSAGVQNFLSNHHSASQLDVLQHLKNLSSLILGYSKPRGYIGPVAILPVKIDPFGPPDPNYEALDARFTCSRLTEQLSKFHPLLCKATNPELSSCLNWLGKMPFLVSKFFDSDDRWLDKSFVSSLESYFSILYTVQNLGTVMGEFEVG